MTQLYLCVSNYAHCCQYSSLTFNADFGIEWRFSGLSDELQQIANILSIYNILV